jgi:hypothetical protein
MGKLTKFTSKILIGIAICVGAGVVGSATAGADPSVFSALSCSCQRAAPTGSPARQDAIARGIQQGLSDLPAVSG